MSFTDDVINELVLVPLPHQSARIAEVATTLRLAGGYERADGALIGEVETEHSGVARRFGDAIEELVGVPPDVVEIPTGYRCSQRYVVRIKKECLELLRRTGLVDRRGAAVRGMPPRIVSGPIVDHEAVWRAAFLIAGELSRPGRGEALEIVCPGPEPAHALVGSARKLGITAKEKERRGQVRVQVRDNEDIGVLLTRLGAYRTRLRWDDDRQRHALNTGPSRLANFDDANLRRSARAAAHAAVRAERAMDLLGDQVPDHLAEAGLLRVQFRKKSLEELGRLADPAVSKDAIAGRIRRLLNMADAYARDRGLEDTAGYAERVFAADDEPAAEDLTKSDGPEPYM